MLSVFPQLNPSSQTVKSQRQQVNLLKIPFQANLLEAKIPNLTQVPLF